jgi:flagellin-specific chaperone FliS
MMNQLNDSTFNTYDSVQMTADEEKKVRLLFQQFRDKTKSMRGRVDTDNVAKDFAAVKRQTDEELKAILGPERFQSFRENLSKRVRLVLHPDLIKRSA